MNNSNDGLTPAMIEAIIQETFQGYVYSLIYASTFLSVYTTLLSFSNEVEHIWLKPFSIPTLLYVFVRYGGGLSSHTLNFFLNFLPAGRTCNIIADISGSADILGYIGVQGLFIARTYALCQGNKIISITLILVFLVGLALDFYGLIVDNGCITMESAQGVFSNLLGNIFTIVTDAIVFGVGLWKVWGTWKLKRGTGAQNRRDLVSKLLEQIISRFCFVVVTSLIGTIIQPVVKSSLIVVFEAIQQALSVVLISDFTLDLRRHNSAMMDPDKHAASFSVIQFREVIQRLHQSVITEMGEPELESGVENSSHDTDFSVDLEDITDESTQHQHPILGSV